MKFLLKLRNISLFNPEVRRPFFAFKWKIRSISRLKIESPVKVHERFLFILRSIKLFFFLFFLKLKTQSTSRLLLKIGLLLVLNQVALKVRTKVN